MKTLYPTQCKKWWIKALALMMISWLTMSGAQAQTAANWSFTNTLTATPGANISAPTITLGTSIVSNAFNAGTEFFGQDGWPSGALDPNAYLQFTVNANAGYFEVLNTVVLTIRHSSLGTAAGSGPASWSLRSSLDGYTADILSGNSLSASYQTLTIPLPAAFQSIPSTVSFRLYGYNETTTSGGSNRLVFDNISVSGQAVSGVLAERSIYLTAKAAGTGANGTGTAAANGAGAVNLQWQTIGFPAATDLIIERSINGIDFSAIGQQTVTDPNAPFYNYEDAQTPSVASLFYRIRANEPGGNTFLSPIATVSARGAGVKAPAIRGVAAQGTSVRTLLHIEETGAYQLCIWSEDGKAVCRQTLNGQAGDAIAEFSFGAHPHGIYVLTLSAGGVNSSRQFMY